MVSARFVSSRSSASYATKIIASGFASIIASPVSTTLNTRRIQRLFRNSPFSSSLFPAP